MLKLMLKNKLSKADFICQDVGEFLLNNPEYENKIHTIVIDPPRAGIFQIFKKSN